MGASAWTAASKRGPRDTTTGPGPPCRRPWVVLTLLLVATIAPLAGCSGDRGDDSRSYLTEDRCQPVDDMNDPSDGSIPSPDELLPDPEQCPEFYEGSGDAAGGAPPVPGVPPVDPGVEPVPPPTGSDPCAEGESLNGFPCTPTPEGPVYITPDPSYPD